MTSALAVAVPWRATVGPRSAGRLPTGGIMEGGYNADILVEVPPGGAMLGMDASWSGIPRSCTTGTAPSRWTVTAPCSATSYNETILPGGSARLGVPGVGTCAFTGRCPDQRRARAGPDRWCRGWRWRGDDGLTAATTMGRAASVISTVTWSWAAISPWCWPVGTATMRPVSTVRGW